MWIMYMKIKKYIFSIQYKMISTFSRKETFSQLDGKSKYRQLNKAEVYI